MKKINAVRGMPDLLPEDISYWQYIEEKLRVLTASFNYSEIRLPIVESTELFKRSVGDVTDIVEKEMYTFEDRNGDNLTLRPEGTAGVVRAGIEHSLFYGETPKLWYLGPMFRHERPQKGRYRQFYQFGMEAFGVSVAYIEAELLAFCKRLWQQLGIDDKVTLQLNCLGTKESRENYKSKLVEYFKNNFDSLDDDSKRRLDKNPLRILDSKNPDLKSLIADAPKLADYLDDSSKEHMQSLYNALDKLNIKYEINPYLVRGLDYYCLTVFEWVTDDLGAQGTVCAGGRYDGLVEDIGGNATPAVGFSIGIDRLVLMLKEFNPDLKSNNNPDIFMVLMGDKAIQQGLVVADSIRQEFSNIKVNFNSAGQSFKNQFKRADKSGAKLAIIIGDDEADNNSVTIKWLRENKEQQTILIDNLKDILRELS